MKKMKTLIIIVASLLLQQTISVAQGNCGQAIVTETVFKNYPELRAAYLKNIEKEKEAATNLACGNFAARTQSLALPSYTIPLVFHILHQGGVENISDAQIADAVAILNRDYQKQNADTASVVPTFTNNIANVGIAFQLAGLDPDGNCTNGIIRHYTSKTNWDANNLNDFIYSWPRENYLNIYIVKTINIPATAYSFLPPVGVPPDADCIVCMHNNCGSIGTSNVALSRVLTHEVGHWLNLHHIWGTSNQPGVVCGDDAVNDTPVTRGFLNCNTLNTAICNPPIEENIQNYMDYSPCKIMFTNGQASRMITCLTGALNDRYNISSPTNLAATGITTSSTNCIPMVEVVTPVSNTLCFGTPLPVYSYTSNAQTTGYSWTASNGVSLSSITGASLVATFSTPGNFVINCNASNPNGSSTASILVTVINNIPQNTGTALESFETNVLPTNWSVLDPDTPASTWDVVSGAGSHGNRCMYVNGEDAPGNSVEILQSPSYDFLNNPGSLFTFKYAYARQSATHKDVFKVQASYDCGGTFKDIYAPLAQTMASGSGETTSSLFFPVANEWKSYDVTAHPQFAEFLDKSNVIFRFYFKEDPFGNGNRFYLDQINFESPVSTSELERSINLSAFPNPAQDQLKINFNLPGSKTVKASLTDIKGMVVYRKGSYTATAGDNAIEFKNMESLSRGIYFLNLEVDHLRIVKKIILA